MRKNNEIDIIEFMNQSQIIIWIIVTIINIINLISWNNKYIVVSVLTVYGIQIINSIIITLIISHNHKVMMKLWEKEKEDFYNNLNIRKGEQK